MLNDTSRGLQGLQNRRTFAPEKVKNEELDFRLYTLDNVQQINNKVMKTMKRMRMQGCCCTMMMTAGKERVYYIIGIEQNKKKHYEKNSISHSSFIEHPYQQYLG
jgi:hypothetical protein